MPVNNAGSVVGDGVQLRKAVLWQKDAAGAYSQIELPTPSGRMRAAAYDINDSGQIVGWVSTSGSRSAIIWEKRAGSDDYEPHYLESPPGATLSAAHAINNSGDVVGWALIPSPPTAFRHAVLWRAGDSGQLVPMELGALPGGTSSDAYGINESGQIVGSSTSWDETAQKLVGHAVLWELDTDVTPPEIRQVEADPAVLWPPNHKMRDVIVRYEVPIPSPISIGRPF